MLEKGKVKEYFKFRLICVLLSIIFIVLLLIRILTNNTLLTLVFFAPITEEIFKITISLLVLFLLLLKLKDRIRPVMLLFAILIVIGSLFAVYEHFVEPSYVSEPTFLFLFRILMHISYTTIGFFSYAKSRNKVHGIIYWIFISTIIHAFHNFVLPFFSSFLPFILLNLLIISITIFLASRFYKEYKNLSAS